MPLFCLFHLAKFYELTRMIIRRPVVIVTTTCLLSLVRKSLESGHHITHSTQYLTRLTLTILCRLRPKSINVLAYKSLETSKTTTDMF